jgi:hypothetical protein
MSLVPKNKSFPSRDKCTEEHIPNKQAILTFHFYDPTRVYILDKENQTCLLHYSVYNNQRVVAIRDPASKGIAAQVNCIVIITDNGRQEESR